MTLEKDGFDELIIIIFQSRNYRVDERERYSFYLNALHSVLNKQEGDGFLGVTEIRRDGTAAGY